MVPFFGSRKGIRWNVAIAIFSVVALVSCRGDRSESKPLLTRKGYGIWRLSTSDAYLTGVSRHDHAMLVWPWRQLGTRPEWVKGPRVCLEAAALLDGKPILAQSSEVDRSYPLLLLQDARSGAVVQKWVIGPELHCLFLRSSQNGKHVAVVATGRASDDVGDYRYPIGVIKESSEEVEWIAEAIDKIGSGGITVSAVAISEDGGSVAAAGLNNGGWIMVADVAGKRKLWEQVPQHSIKFADVVFSPSGKRVYASGSGTVFGFDVGTGEIVSQWVVHESGRPQYGHRVTALAATPDGRLIAAGTGPQGAIYVFEAETGTRLLHIKTGQATIMGLAFSPDSTLLASTGVQSEKIAVWKMPEAANKMLIERSLPEGETRETGTKKGENQ